MEKYSVLMSLYKKEHPEYLRLALDSMINQTVEPDEIVLVEDGPLTDELYAVIDEYKEVLHIVKNEKNLGLGLALNKGLSACKNEFVARMDTDDISMPARCEMQLKHFEMHPETTILGGQIEEFISSSSEVVGRRVVPENDEEIKKYMKKRCPFNHMTVMFKKSEVIKAGSYQDWFSNEDYDLWIRLALKGAHFENLPEVLVQARVGLEMYERRGGKRYYESEKQIQRFMYKTKLIDKRLYIMNCMKRFIVEIVLPNKIRGIVFRLFAREQHRGIHISC